MLSLAQVSAQYGMHRALRAVSLSVGQGEVVSVLGANGAGKSTLLKVIAGLVQPGPDAKLTLAGHTLLGMAVHTRVACGLAYVPDNRGVFGALTVRDNLRLGAFTPRARDREHDTLASVLALFPRLNERLSQVVSTMSGGEQQMVAIGRALMSNPKVLLLDEPSLGLSPLLVGELFKALARVREAQVSVLIVEQNAQKSLALSHRGYLLAQGVIVGQGSATELLQSQAVRKAYLGG